MCGRVQPSSPRRSKRARAKPQSRTSKKSPRSRRLTKEHQQLLMADIKQGIDSGDLNIRDLSKKYKVSAKTVAYWKKKVE
jgi:ribosome-binding protein aMBF1 (putative translation factor)